FSITMVTSACAGAPEPSITVACVKAVTCAAALPANASTAARTTGGRARMDGSWKGCMPRLRGARQLAGGSARLRALHHRRHEMLDGGRADLLHGGHRF